MTKKAFDPSKFRKSLTKSITGMSAGFNDPSVWIDTGNYVLNYLISGNFYNGVPLGKVSIFAGESGCLPATANVRIRSKKDKSLITNITVEQLRALYHSEDKNEFEIATPDGYANIINWYDKGEMSMIRIVTPNFTTKCATNHLLQLSTGQWIPAIKLNQGDKILTETGPQQVLKSLKSKPEYCYDFEIDHPNHRYWGDGLSSHNSGKSYICSGNIVRDAQEKGIFVVLIDSENALDESWLQKLGVKTDEDHLLKLNMAMVDDVAKTISSFMKDYKEMENEERPKVLFVIDSLGMLLTPTEVSQFGDGDMKGDMGRKAKSLKALVSNCVNMFGEYNIGLVATNHTYESQNMFSPDPKISGGNGPIFASSIVVRIQKVDLKEDTQGVKTPNPVGIKASCKVVKTRYTKPFESVKIHIPYETGMDRYSGLLEFFEKNELLTKVGNKLQYIDLDGNEHRHFRKQWTSDKLDLIMQEFDQQLYLKKIQQQTNKNNDDIIGEGEENE